MAWYRLLAHAWLFPLYLVVRRTLLLGAYYLLGACFLRGTWHHSLSACALNRVHDGGERSSENHGIKNTQHTSMFILKSTKDTQALPASGKQSLQATSFAAYETISRTRRA